MKGCVTTSCREVVGLSIGRFSSGTGESAWLLLGLTGMGAAIDSKPWVVLGEVLGVGIAWLFMSRRHASRNAMIRLLSPIILSLVFAIGRKRFVRWRHCFSRFHHRLCSAQIDATGKAFEDF